jgi:hypothetical protein
MRAQDILPDGADRADFDGVSVRKGTVGAFIANATAWCDPATPANTRDALAAQMRESIPALDALGVFRTFELRDPRLRDLLDR